MFIRGKVSAFDEAAGIGEVVSEAGKAYPFHCTQIADGTRAIPTDADVWFEVIAGHRGQWEASRVTRR